MEYADEPPLVFAALSEKDYCRFYQLEMEGYREDAEFYTSRLGKDLSVLELGCGSGRLTRLLAESCRDITAVDISEEMIRLARRRPRAAICYRHEDMLEISFRRSFDVIVIPYNTLNLLGSGEAVRTCLQGCRNHLGAGGRLLLHLYHPDVRILQLQGEKLFQFSIHDLPEGGRLIKETLKSYDARQELLTLEERYRYRPEPPGSGNRDFRHFLRLFTPLPPRWQSLLRESGFATLRFYGDFDGSPVSAETTTLLIDAAP